MLTALYTILVFCLIIAVHEFGHFALAKLTGVTVHEFSIGMGPKLFSFSTCKTAYSLRLLPIGGYVKLEGEDEQSDDVNAFCNKKPWKRLLVLFAGAFMNFLLGFLIFVILFSSAEGISTNIIGNVIENSAFEDANIMPGDKIVRMEGANYSSNIGSYNDVSYFIMKNGSTKTKFTFKRDGKYFIKTISPRKMDSYEQKMFGFGPEIEKPNFFNVFSSSFNQSKFVIKVVVSSFADLITGRESFSNMSGPVGIVSEIGSVAKEGMKENFLQGFLNVMSLAALISINLGVVNLLPLPALDGGRILFIIIEIIRRKPVDRDKEGFFHFIGFALLIALIIFITLSDIGKLIT